MLSVCQASYYDLLLLILNPALDQALKLAWEAGKACGKADFASCRQEMVKHKTAHLTRLIFRLPKIFSENEDSKHLIL